MKYNQNTIKNIDKSSASCITGWIENTKAENLAIVEIDTELETVEIELLGKDGQQFAVNNKIASAILKPNCVELNIFGTIVAWKKQ